MPKCRALTTSFVNNQIVEEGWEGHVPQDEIGRNFVVLDKSAKQAQDKAALPPDVQRLVTSVRLKATTRGAASPDEANAIDLRDVLTDLGDKAQPPQEVIDAAAKVLEAMAKAYDAKQAQGGSNDVA